MHAPLLPLVCAMVAATLAAACAETLFEDVHAVQWPKKAHGYRGNNGDFLVLGDGAVAMAYMSQADIVAKKSTDRGRTWGEEYLLVAKPKPPAKGSLAHPSFLRLSNGHVLLSYIHNMHPATPYYANCYYRRSADEGKTWSEPYILTPYPGYVLVHNDRLSTLSTGRILAMAEYKAHYPSTRDHSGYVGMAFYSDDLGYTWHPSKNVVDMMPVEVQEADAVELKDGRLMMFARTYSGYPVRAYSSDGGETWSEGAAMKELAMPYAGLPTVRRIPSTGDLLFIWISERSVDKDDPKVHQRCALTSAISKDEGKTFEHFRHIARDPDDDFGYQAVEFLDQGLVLVSYHARDGLHVARMGVEWFYGGGANPR